MDVHTNSGTREGSHGEETHRGSKFIRCRFLSMGFPLPVFFLGGVHKRFQISVMVPAATVNAGEPNVPTKSLQITNVSIFLASAQPIWKTTKSAQVGIYTTLRP